MTTLNSSSRCEGRKINEVITNVTMDFFNSTPSRSDVVVTPAIIHHVINFSDDVNKSKYASLLKQSFYLKQYFEHFYDENGKENTLKRFLGKVKVSITPDSVTIEETRQAFKKHITYTYHFNNSVEVEELESFFNVSTEGIPTDIDNIVQKLTDIKLNGGSVIKAILLGNDYCDKYYDRITKRPKTHKLEKVSKAMIDLTCAIGTLSLIFAL